MEGEFRASKLSGGQSVTTLKQGSHETSNQLQQLCEVKFDGVTTQCRKTSIIATVGVSCCKVETLLEMMQAGMCIVRFNFSHDSHEMHSDNLKNAQEAAKLYGKQMGFSRHIAYAVDIKGPEVRTGLLEGGRTREIELRAGELIRLSTNKDLFDKGTRECVYVDYPNIINIAPGTRVFIDDGALLVIAKETSLDSIICEVQVGGILGNLKTVNMPDIFIDLPPVSEKDQFDIKFAIHNQIDFIFASHIYTKQAVPEIRNLLGDKGKHIKIIAKIENRQCLHIIDDIIKASDGILFARADLAIEIPPERVFLLQKSIIARCNRASKPVIIATQLLSSMRVASRPTLSEVLDVGNAVLDGSDCLMLSTETATSPYPIQCIKIMASICREAEEAVWFRDFFNELLARNPAKIDAAHAIAISAVDAARKSSASAIIVLTTTGRSAHLISAYRPHCPIIAISRCARTARQCHLYRGILPLLYANPVDVDWILDIDKRLNYGLYVGKRMGIVSFGDPVLVISPWKSGDGFTNNMRIVYAFFESENFKCIFKENKKTLAKRPAKV